MGEVEKCGCVCREEGQETFPSVQILHTCEVFEDLAIYRSCEIQRQGRAYR